jgi:hypothetical protein
MPKTIDALTLLSSAAMMSRKAQTYPETQVIDLAELRQIIWELSDNSEQDALPS